MQRGARRVDAMLQQPSHVRRTLTYCQPLPSLREVRYV